MSSASPSKLKIGRGRSRGLLLRPTCSCSGSDVPPMPLIEIFEIDVLAPLTKKGELECRSSESRSEPLYIEHWTGLPVRQLLFHRASLFHDLCYFVCLLHFVIVCSWNAKLSAPLHSHCAQPSLNVDPFDGSSFGELRGWLKLPI